MIKDGEVIQADEIINNCIGRNFSNQAQLLFNSAYIGFNSKLNVATGVPNLKNVKYDCFLTDTMTKTNMVYDATNKFYFGPETPNESDYSVYDDCNNSSVDTNLWTVYTNDDASVTEDGTKMTIYARGINTGDRLSEASITSKSISFSTYNCLMINIPSLTIVPYSSTHFYITFGGVNIFDTATTQTNIKIQIMKVGSFYYYRVYSSSAWGSWTQFSPSTTALVIDAYAVATSPNYGTITAEINNIRYNTLASFATGGSYIISPSSAISVTDVIATCNYLASVGLDIYLSSDNGANYELCTDATIHRFTDTGSSLLVKLVLKGVGAISEYAILYNITNS